MKYLKTYKALFENDNDSDYVYTFEDELESYGIENYTIREGNIIDVDGDVDISRTLIESIPFKFGRVTGSFNCSENHLISLKNCPSYVGGDFDCSQNRLKTLEGSPEEVGRDFNCAENKLETLKHAPIEIGGNFSCSNNKLNKIDMISNIEGLLICGGNNINPDKTDFNGYAKEIVFTETDIYFMNG